MKGDEAARQRFPWRSCLLVFLVAFGLRLYFVAGAPEDWIRPSADWEIDSIAISLVTRGEFADPYVVPSGPTAHLPPVPPMILALIYSIFGITMTAGIVEWVLNMFFQSAIWGLLPWVGERVGLGWKAGLAGGLAGALWPQWMGHGEGPAAVLLGLLAVALVRRWGQVRGKGAAPLPRGVSSILLGAAFGISFHLQPAFLPVFLGYLAFELWWRADRRKWRSAGLVLLGALVVCLPWGLRNYLALDAVFFVRSNLGLELRMGNHDGATANIDDPHFHNWPPHPRLHREEAIKVRDWGEVAYMRDSGRQALEWIGANPGEFARLTARRLGYFWLGPLDQPGYALLFAILTGLATLGAARAIRVLPRSRSAVLLIPLLAFPPIYYVVPWQQRYRFPIDWILFLLAGAAVWGWTQSRAAGVEQSTGPEDMLDEPASLARTATGEIVVWNWRLPLSHCRT